MRELDKVLNKDERVLWEGKPKLGPFFFAEIIYLILAMMVFVVILWYVTTLNAGPDSFIFVLLPMSILILSVVIVVIVHTGLVYRKTYYAITDKRVILQGGLVGRDFYMMDFDKINNLEVNVGVADKLFGGNSGSIIISTGNMTYLNGMPKQIAYIMKNVLNPYDVFKYFKKVSFDVKTDIEYPNKYRPDTNPGYRTRYQ